METTSSWEDAISLNSSDTAEMLYLDPAISFMNKATVAKWPAIAEQVCERVMLDSYPLPLTADREGYFGDDHFSYWASGLDDWMKVKSKVSEYGVRIESYLDFGCASGRVIRHAALDPEGGAKVYGCDINQRHIRWGAKHLPRNLTLFQNTSIPFLAIESNTLDLVTGYSVFSHIEALETTWLMEIRRILKPGGIAWVTIHSDHTLLNLNPGWPVHSAVVNHPTYAYLDLSNGMPTDRMVFRWRADKSYSSNIFYKRSYIEETWSRIMTIRDFLVSFPNYQDTVILQKT